MWLLVLLVVKCNDFLLEAGILHGYPLVTCWLLVRIGSWLGSWLLIGYSFMLCCSCSVQLLMRYPIKEDTDLNKNADILPERCNFFLHL